MYDELLSYIFRKVGWLTCALSAKSVKLGTIICLSKYLLETGRELPLKSFRGGILGKKSYKMCFFGNKIIKILEKEVEYPNLQTWHKYTSRFAEYN